MDSKEKAEELYWDFEANKNNAIRCVDEIISLHKKVALQTLEFYVEVRKELEKYD